MSFFVSLLFFSTDNKAPQLFLSEYGFHPHLSGECGIRIRNFFNPLPKTRYESGIVWTLNSDIFYPVT